MTSSPKSGRRSVSIIIPTLNEADYLGHTLNCLRYLDPPAAEILVVDGDSQDETITIAKAANIPVMCSQQTGQSHQMNHGAKLATGDILCFLHADTSVPSDLVAVIEKTLSDSTIACGGFVSLMTGFYTTHWGLSLLNYLKTYCTPLLFHPRKFFFRGFRLLFGDQVMFCRREQFWGCGGFDSTMPIMEDADLCFKLNRYGWIRQVNRVVQSSDRRVVTLGFFKALIIYFSIGVLWSIGVPATRLKSFYLEIR